MAHTIFVNCICNNVDFTYANLNNASFYGAALYGTNFSFTNLQKADFSFANLYKADFSNSNITDSQLRSALSIRDAKLPNGTLGQGYNLVKNGDANCNITLVQDWRIHNDSIAVIASKKGGNDCQFSLQPFVTEAVMSQQISFTEHRSPSFLIQHSVELQADMSDGVLIELSGIHSNGTILKKTVVSKLRK